MKSKDQERGAAAVEFALVLPVLLAVLLGIMEFGFLFNQQISATNAAREGARFAAVHYQDTGFNDGQAISAARSAAPTLSSATTTVSISYSAGSCASGGTVTVTVKPKKGWLTGFFDIGTAATTTTAPQLTGKAVMQCGG